MTARRKVGNPLALAVMSYLMQGPMHPYQLSRTLRRNGDARSIKFTHGSLYMVVEQLARAGFIVEQETTRTGHRPERTVYALTDAGRAELRDWMRELVADPQHEYPQFVAALSLIAALPPGEVVELLDRRLHRLTELRTEIRDLVDGALDQEVHPLFLVEEEYRLALLDAESGFVRRFIGQINDPGWSRLWARFHEEPAAGPDPLPATTERESS
jgi:DNA-binding PadR family transcriptional regulator